jgi:hypothetical protein
MKKLLNFALISVLLTGISLAQNSAQPSAASESQNTAFRLAPETILRVELAKSVDAKKAKVGDEVMAKTIDDFLSDKNEVLAPKGSRVLGHVAVVSPHQGESASTLGIAFDKIVLKNGTEVGLKASIQAIGPPESNAAAGNDNMGAPANSGGMSPMSSPGRGAYGGTTPNPAGTMPGNVNNPGPAAQDASQNTSQTAAINGRLTPNAQGVVGMSGLSLSTGAAQDSLLSSAKHNVKLDSGTQMILRVTS